MMMNKTENNIDLDLVTYVTDITRIIAIPCLEDKCKKNDTHVFLRSADSGYWKTYDGYLDPAKDFTRPKKFSRKVTQWVGTCKDCGRNYRGVFRITQED